MVDGELTIGTDLMLEIDAMVSVPDEGQFLSTPAMEPSSNRLSPVSVYDDHW